MTATTQIEGGSLALAAFPNGDIPPNSPLATGVTPPPAPVASLILPAPPSVNAMFRNAPGKGRVKTRDYHDWSEHAAWSIRSQKPASIRERCVVLLGVERHAAHADIDNRNKAVLDALVTAGVIKDDSLVTAIFSVWHPAANHLAHVQIYPCQPMTLTFHPSRNGASGTVIVNAPLSME